MIFRFCLYGFLKNQRYFDPFWILAFVDKGLSYSLIGALLGFREICVSLLEIPTGGIADSVGRRWAMICSHTAYVISFITFAFSTSTTNLFVATFVFSIGEAFRSGTHKAMIFSWLKSKGRESEKVEIYGLTRSWSKLGSAVSTIVAAIVVFAFQDYAAVFWLSAIPASLNIINFFGYSKELDGLRSNNTTSLTQLFGNLWKDSLKCLAIPEMRRPIMESMGFEGMYKSAKDYVQPAVQQMVLAMPLALTWNASQRTALAIAFVYTTIHLVSSLAARRAGRVVSWLGENELAGRRLWKGLGLAFLAILLGATTSQFWFTIVGFCTLAILQNLWRPWLVSRVADFADEQAMATTLSVESQAKSLGAAAIATLLGFFVDITPPPFQFSSIAIVGLGVVGAALYFPSNAHMWRGLLLKN